MIEVTDLKVTYSGVRNISLEMAELEIHEGECVVLCGKSGSGKSTFLRVLNGLIPEYYDATHEGDCTIDGTSVWNQTVEELSFTVGTVFQNPATQFFHRQVRAELVFPCENQGLDREEIERRLNEVVSLLELESYLDKDLLHLSGGERQKVALATALMQQPQVLLLDEPTANLDEEGIAQLTEALVRIKASGLTILMSEHRLHFMTAIADRYVYIDNGRLTQQWTASQFEKISTEERRVLGLRSRHAHVLRQSSVMDLQQPGMQLEELSIGYRQSLLQLPTMTLPYGHIIGILGNNGIGKTTLLNTIAGLQQPIRGRITQENRTLTTRELQSQTAFVMQDVRLQFVTPTVRAELQLGTGTRPNDEVVSQLELAPLLDRHPLSLSGGQQQRVMIANAREMNKQVYIFDEPTSGLDYLQMLEVGRLLQSLTNDEQLVLVVSHDREFLEVCADCVLDLNT